jgi:hypothetical protein
MEISGDNDRAFLRLIFAASFASLSYELALMRIFSMLGISSPGRGQ